jgi:hypothetical protein
VNRLVICQTANGPSKKALTGRLTF